VEQGTHRELLKRKGLYYGLVLAQMQGRGEEMEDLEEDEEDNSYSTRRRSSMLEYGRKSINIDEDDIVYVPPVTEDSLSVRIFILCNQVLRRQIRRVTISICIDYNLIWCLAVSRISISGTLTIRSASGVAVEILHYVKVVEYSVFYQLDIMWHLGSAFWIK